jgi:hypothetical protein
MRASAASGARKIQEFVAAPGSGLASPYRRRCMAKTPPVADCVPHRVFPVILAGPIWPISSASTRTPTWARRCTVFDGAPLGGSSANHGVQNPHLRFIGLGLFRRRAVGHQRSDGISSTMRDLSGSNHHFARWVFIDQKRRAFFASNHDGSLENYMDDFVDKIARRFIPPQQRRRPAHQLVDQGRRTR